jgi:hypothetical protein
LMSCLDYACIGKEGRKEGRKERREDMLGECWVKEQIRTSSDKLQILWIIVMIIALLWLVIRSWVITHNLPLSFNSNLLGSTTRYKFWLSLAQWYRLHFLDDNITIVFFHGWKEDIFDSHLNRLCPITIMKIMLL